MSARLYLANAGRTQLREATASFLFLSFDAALYVVERTESVAVTVTLARENVSDDVTLSVAGLPAGTTGSFSPAVLSGGTLVSTLTLTASGAAELVNLQNVAVSASTALGIATSRSFALTVEDVVVAPGALFVLSASPSAVNLVRESTATSTISIVRANPGYTGVVTPALVEALPSGVTVAFVPATFAGATTSVVATFTATDVAALGIAPLTIRGTGAGSEPNDTSFSVQVIAAGAFAHLAPPSASMPLQEDGSPMTFDPSTGLYGGTVFNTAWLSRAWLIANVDTVVTVRASGGTFTPAQFQTALNEAAIRNDNTVIVVDAGLNLDCIGTASWRLKSKAGTVDTAGWTFVVAAPFWSGDWIPVLGQYPDLRPVANGGAEEQQHMFYVRDNTTSGSPNHIIANDSLRIFRYGMIGAYIVRHPNRTSNTNVGSNIQMTETTGESDSTIFRHCVLDGGFRLDYATGIVYRGARNVVTYGRRFALESCALIRTWFNGGESNAVTQTRGNRTKIVDCLIESASIGILTGGGGTGGLLPSDMEFRRNYMVKGQHINNASHLNGRNFITAFGDATGTAATTGTNLGWGTGKQHIEVKNGVRMLIEGNITDSNWHSNAGRGTGISVQLTAQSSLPNFFVKDIIVANNFVTRCNNPFYVNPYYNSLPSLNPDPCQRIDIVNNVFMKVRAEETTTVDQGDILGMTSAGLRDPAYDGTVLQAGPIRATHNTWVVPVGQPGSSGYRYLQVSPFISRPGNFVAFDVSMINNIFPNRWNLASAFAGISYISPLPGGATPSHTDWALMALRAPGHDQWHFQGNAIPNDLPRMTRAGSESLFPDQYAPAALWRAQGDNPWGWTSHVANQWDCDFSLASDSPLKGISVDGTDPGVEWSVLQAAIAGVRQYRPEDIGLGITVDWVEAP